MLIEFIYGLCLSIVLSNVLSTMIKPAFFIFLIVFLPGFFLCKGYSQTDSLMKALDNACADAENMDLMMLLGQEFSCSNPDTALYFLSQALTLSQEAGDKSYQIQAYYQMGDYYGDHKKLNEALEYFQQSHAIA